MDFVAGITAITAVAAAAGYVAKLSADFSKVKTRLDHLEGDAGVIKADHGAMASNTREKLNVLTSSINSTEARVAHLVSRMEEDRARADRKFTELAELKDETRQTLIELQASVDTLSRLFESRFASLEKQVSGVTEQVKELTKQVTRKRKDNDNQG